MERITLRSKLLIREGWNSSYGVARNVTFNYYGNADYTFQYVKDKLVSIKLLFSFEAKDTMKFRRLYKTLVSDLNNDQSKDLLKQYSDLNQKDVFDYIKAHCRTGS